MINISRKLADATGGSSETDMGAVDLGPFALQDHLSADDGEEDFHVAADMQADADLPADEHTANVQGLLDNIGPALNSLLGAEEAAAVFAAAAKAASGTMGSMGDGGGVLGNMPVYKSMAAALPISIKVGQSSEQQLRKLFRDVAVCRTAFALAADLCAVRS
eukprot:gene12056-12198_t